MYIKIVLDEINCENFVLNYYAIGKKEYIKEKKILKITQNSMLVFSFSL